MATGKGSSLATFPKTREGLDGIYKMLRCVKCSVVPKEKVFMLGGCDHKYCEICLEIFVGKACHVCKKVCLAKDAGPDRFTSNFLQAIKTVEMTLEDEIQQQSKKPKRSPSVETSTEKKQSSKRSFSEEISTEQKKPSKKNSDEISTEQKKPSKKNSDEISTEQKKPSKKNSVEISTEHKKSLGKIGSTGFKHKLKLKLHKESPTTKSSDELTKDEDITRKEKETNRKARKRETKKETVARDSLEVTLSKEQPEVHSATTRASKRKDKITLEDDTPQMKPSGEQIKEKVSKKQKENVSAKVILKSDRKRKVTQDEDIPREKKPEEGKKMIKISDETSSSDDTNKGASASSSVSKRERSKGSPEITDLGCHTPVKSKSLKRKRNHSSASASSASSSRSNVQISARANSPSSPLNTSFSSSAGVNKKNSKGETQLHVACRAGQLEKIKQLVEMGADINAQDFAGWTPLHEAIMGKGENRLDLVMYMCKQKCNTNVPGMDNEFALHEAARTGVDELVKCLLSHSASPNVRNAQGQLPRDVAATDAVKMLLDEAAGFECDGNESLNASMSDDPVVLQLQFSRAVLFFSYDLPEKDRSAVAEMNLQISKTLKGEVTHIIFDIPQKGKGNDKSNRERETPFSPEYLHGITHGTWMLYKEWIDKCIAKKKLLSPKDYEVSGCYSVKDAPTKARLNKEVGNPGLLDGFTFYLYKNCYWEGFNKQQLSKLITAAEGRVINREPRPDSVDPLEVPIRFHAKEHNHKLVITSHVILYGDQDVPSHERKLNMEHIKTLHVKWLIESLGSFSLLDPELYL